MKCQSFTLKTTEDIGARNEALAIMSGKHAKAQLDRLGRYEEALESYEQLVRLKPGDVMSETRLGEAYARLGC